MNTEHTHYQLEMRANVSLFLQLKQHLRLRTKIQLIQQPLLIQIVNLKWEQLPLCRHCKNNMDNRLGSTTHNFQQGKQKKFIVAVIPIYYCRTKSCFICGAVEATIICRTVLILHPQGRVHFYRMFSIQLGQSVLPYCHRPTTVNTHLFQGRSRV